VRCSKCGAENREGAKFCKECAAPILANCSHCGAVNQPGSKFCDECAAPLTGKPGSKDQPAEAAPVRVLTEGASTQQLGGERKTVTALFADIKGSTELERDLDPEESRAIVDPALKLMIDAVRRYDGYVVQSTGDGIFALFGAPVASEDHPQRALHASLRMQADITRYGSELQAQGRTPIEIRVGVNTGEVVVRSIATGDSHTEYTPIGHTTNLASRLQGIARTGAIVVSEETRKLCEGYFKLNRLPAARIKGLNEPVNLYEVVGLGPLRTRLQRAEGRGLTRFVGRQRELDVLRNVASQAKEGRGQVAATVADAGVGKSRLFREFKAITQSDWQILETFSVSHARAVAYMPVTDLLVGYFGIAASDDQRRRREKVAGKIAILDRALEDTLPYLYSLLAIGTNEDGIVSMDAEIRQRRTRDAIKRVLLRESLNQPLMLIFEDLHWIDKESEGLIDLLVDSIAASRILLLVNYRPEYVHHWGSRSVYTQLRLDPLGRDSLEEMLNALVGTGKELDPIKRLIIQRTEGNPFFIEEMVQSLFEEGSLIRNGAVQLVKSIAEIKVPSTVHGVLASRVDRLPGDEKDFLQTLAVIGREFPLSLVTRVSQLGEETITRMLADLELAEFIYEHPETTNTELKFKHALTQEVVYGSVLGERRKLLHERVGGALESLYGDHPDNHLIELAYHYSRSTNTAKAVHYLLHAAQHARRRSSCQEAAELSERGLALIGNLGSEERSNAELSLVLTLIEALVGAKGYAAPELEKHFRRALELCDQVGNRRQLVLVLNRLMFFYAWRAEWAENRRVGHRMLEIATKEKSSVLMGLARVGLMDGACLTGNLLEARSHAAAINDLTVTSPDQEGFDRNVWNARARWCEAYVLWFLGYADQAVNSGYQAVKQIRSWVNAQVAGAIGGYFELAQLLNNCHQVFLLSGNMSTARRFAEEALSVADRFGLRNQLAWATFNLGHSLLSEGKPDQGVSQMLVGMAGHEEAGNRIKTWMLAPLANGYRLLRDTEKGLDVVDRALAMANETGELLWKSEILRLKGELILLGGGATTEAERLFKEAIGVAQAQAAKSWELRASLSRARLLANQGKGDLVDVTLKPICDWFTEGFHTPDFLEAKSLLGTP